MAKITGLGGVFYVVKDPAATRAWYREKLGLDGEYGPQLSWSEETGDQPYSLISHFKESKYLEPGNPHFMINLRVDDLDSFVTLLKSRDVEVLDFVDEGYGKFAWVLDPDGVKIELWQQVEAP
ncbi:VOC family protein [Altererythrobacter sp. RZ02]|uniref:VOC family protein n=1 Tax=Pontixanthobacter rizhaonensis TaxID=2730337 RepID=A0A848QMG7_9SPHN|nr:VOC family protein [Pontixanthobacter rizhaonensis]NMW31940.1 VOC family protein [Pontixanthobacter rizhaonensis]